VSDLAANIVGNACALVMASGVLLMKWRFRDPAGR